MRAKLISKGSLTFYNNAGEPVTMQAGDVRDDIPLCIFENNKQWLEALPPLAPVINPDTELGEIRQTTQLKAKRAYKRGLDSR